MKNEHTTGTLMIQKNKHKTIISRNSREVAVNPTYTNVFTGSAAILRSNWELYKSSLSYIPARKSISSSKIISPPKLKLQVLISRFVGSN
ncbi:hypothetical protein CDL15_Pgr008958 [Punica granatum]|uniref:Uncharacterized protein n=1 Tax=Punica granatum TaxID=22663 RepID=A0A218VYS8_PUNGR|nr:hypothetical protein CDL15_Pgr008958 [Punica granatum]